MRDMLPKLGLWLLLTIALLAHARADVPFDPYVVEAGFDGPASVYACDIDGDGDKDVLGAAANANDIAWWSNGGGLPITWTKQTIADAFGGAIFVYAEDVDGDLDTDILGAAWNRGQIAWWRNDGGNPLTWVKYTISSTFVQAHEVFASDIDGDGDQDVLGASAGNNCVAWWRNDGGSPIVWTEQTIGSGFGGARSARAADFDGDGDQDVVGAALVDNEVAWWRNDGGNPIVWTEFSISTAFSGSHMVRPIDLDKDGDQDIVGAAYSSGEVAWWRNDGGNPVVWTKQTVASGFTGAVTAYPGDIDSDGDIDILGAAQDAGDLAWWSNDGGVPIVWTLHNIDANFAGAWPAFPCDLDGDGATDVLAGGFDADEIRWWHNGQMAGLDGGQGENAPPMSGVRLCRNTPNPFSFATTVHYTVGSASAVRVAVYDASGHVVKTLVNEPQNAGWYSVPWDGTDADEHRVSAGVYFVRRSAGGHAETRAVVLSR